LCAGINYSDEVSEASLPLINLFHRSSYFLILFEIVDIYLLKQKTKIMKNYTFIYSDSRGNELDRVQLLCFNDSEAYEVSKNLFAETMINDCTEVYFLD
jgi:hypothetical protein